MEVSGILYEKGMRQMIELFKIAEQVVGKLKEQGLFITTMESCTGGGVVNCITNVEGASEVISGARVAYSAGEKIAAGVPEELTAEGIVYSEETAIAMARAGVGKALRADIGVGITGHIYAFDAGRENEVFIAVVFGEQVNSGYFTFPVRPNRREAKEDIVEKTLRMVLEVLQEL